MPQSARDAGYTLIEVLVTISLMGAMMAIAVGGWNVWSHAHEQAGTAHELQSFLRSSQQRAITEGNSFCVTVQSQSYSLYDGPCTAMGSRVQGPVETNSADVALSGGPVTFLPRGTASAAPITVTRTGSTKHYVLKVDGLTGRVSLD